MNHPWENNNARIYQICSKIPLQICGSLPSQAEPTGQHLRLLTPTQPPTCWSSKDVFNPAVKKVVAMLRNNKFRDGFVLSIFLTLLWALSFVSTIGCLATNMIVTGCVYHYSWLTDRPSQICNYWVKSSKYWSAGVTCSQQSAGQNHLVVTSH